MARITRKREDRKERFWCSPRGRVEGVQTLPLSFFVPFVVHTAQNLARSSRLCHNLLMAVDTLKLYERLVKANVAPEASREIAEAISESSAVSLEGLATKEDLFALKGDLAKLENKMEQRFSQVDQRIAQLEVQLIKWIIGVGITGFTALLGLLKIIKVI